MKSQYYKLGKYMLGVGLAMCVVGYALMWVYEDYRPREYVVWDVNTLEVLDKTKMSQVSFRAFNTEPGVMIEENVSYHTMDVVDPWWLSLAKFIGQMQALSCSNTTPPSTGPAPDPNTPNTQRDDWWFSKVQGVDSYKLETADGVSICGIDSGFTPHPDIKVEGTATMVGGSVTDLVGHGSATLSIMAGLNNNIGIRGISKAKLYMCKALGDDGSGSLDGIAKCVQWCTNSTPARVINMSLGGPQGSQLLYQSIAQARSRGIYVIAAAGNEGNTQPNYPAAFDNVISVSATTVNDTLARFSTYGKVEYSAPGENVLVSVPLGAKMCNGSSGYCTVSGTSFSSPLTAGICALALAKNKTCDNLGVDNIGGNAMMFGKGRVNSLKTVQ